MTSPLSLENIKFHLIWNKDASFQRGTQTVSLHELIEFLIESLEDADKVNANKAENLLTRVGLPAVPYLIQGLKSNHRTVKSVCAMVLVRIGKPAADAVKEFYIRNANRPKLRWIAEFILAELNETLPAVELTDMEPAAKVVPLTKVG